MEKPIIYLCEPMKEEQVVAIQAAANGYTVIDSTRTATAINEEAIEIMLGWNQKIGERLLDSSTSRLKWVQSISAGVDGYNLTRFKEKGILLSTASGIHSISIAEHVLGVLLAEFRGIRSSIINQLNSEWHHTNGAYMQLSQQKMLIVGTGSIGQQLAYFAKGLGIQPYGINTSGHATDGFIECYAQKNMHRIIHELSIVVNVLPLTSDTYHLYNKELFNQLAPQTTFVNVGRGSSVHTADLIEALENGQLRFAALDVFEEEPLPKDSPLWSMKNVLITPHISGLTPHFKSLLLAIFLKNLASFIKDGTLEKNQVSLDRGY